MANFKNSSVLIAIGLWTLLPAVVFSFQLVERYDRDLSAYIFQPISFSNALAWLDEPEFILFGKIIYDRLAVTLVVSVVSSVTAIIMLLFMKPKRVAMAVIFTVVGFFVPPIVKAYAWEQMFRDIRLWNTIGIYVYAWAAFFGFYLASMRMRVQGTSLSAFRAMRECFSPFAMGVELGRLCCWPIAFSALCTFSLLVFSGDELRRFGDSKVFNDMFVASIDPGRHRIGAFVGLACIIVNLFTALASYLVLTRFRRHRFD